jgi:ABC-type branched-subunit amino acid transport system substrate-binding protein
LPGGEAEAPPKSETETEAAADAADAAGAESEGTETSESAPSDAAETPPEAETAAPPDTGTAARLPAPDGAPAEPDAGDAQTEQAPERIELEEPKGEPLRQTVGLLLPLSGPKGALGETMLRAAEMAMFDVAGERFELIVRDTKGTPDGAEAAAREAVDAGANLLLGPVFASSVKAVKPVAKGGQVPVLAFSNNPSVAEPGAYVMGLMPAQQVRRVVSYAVRQGRRHYAVLAPRNAYGQLVVQSLRAATRRYGGTLHHVAFYPPGSQDVSDEVKAVANAGFGERQGAAVMLPAGGKQLQTLAPTLPFFDIDPDKVRFLGTTLWNDPSLGTEPSLVGGWFAAPPPDQRDTFRRRYRATFASDPGELASLAYDATALASLLARRNARDGNPPPAAFTEEKLTQRNGFAGVDGVFRLNRDGTVRRLYAVLEMQRNNLEVVDPAPSRFEPRIN